MKIFTSIQSKSVIRNSDIEGKFGYKGMFLLNGFLCRKSLRLLGTDGFEYM